MKHAWTLSLPFAWWLFACGGTVTPSDSGSPTDSALASDAAAEGGAGLDASGPDASGPSADAACTAVATAACMRLAACSMTNLTLRYGDLATCVAAQRSSCTTALGAAGTGNTPARVSGCADAYAGWSCNDYLAGLNVPAACAQARGTLATGAACAFNAQCSTGFCALARNTACGTCQAEPMVGSDCSTFLCGQGLYCASNNTCATPVATGGTCDASHPCVAGTTCVTPAGATAGLCQTQGTMGMPCDINRRTAPACSEAAGFVCNTASRTCVPLTIASAGMPCAVLGMGNFGVCAAAGACVRPMGSTMGTCLAAVPAGMPCDTANGPDCVAPARCVLSADGGTAGVCTQLDATRCN